MQKASYSIKLFREFVQFAREKRAYWIIPLVLMLGIMSILIVAGQASAPWIYALF